MTMQGQLDDTDYRILSILQHNARLDTSQIAIKVYKSHTATTVHISGLKEWDNIQRNIVLTNRHLISWLSFIFCAELFEWRR